jgi:hypothetical protein
VNLLSRHIRDAFCEGGMVRLRAGCEQGSRFEVLGSRAWNFVGAIGIRGAAEEKQIPPLRYGMTNKKRGTTNKNEERGTTSLKSYLL